MWFVSWDLVLLAVAEFFVPALHNGDIASGFAVALRSCHNSKLLAVFRRIVAPEGEIGHTKARLAE